MDDSRELRDHRVGVSDWHTAVLYRRRTFLEVGVEENLAGLARRLDVPASLVALKIVDDLEALVVEKVFL